MRGRASWIDNRRIIAIFVARGSQKDIAKANGVTQGYVSRIKSGDIYPEVTSLYRQSTVMTLNAMLATLACTGAP